MDKVRKYRINLDKLSDDMLLTLWIKDQDGEAEQHPGQYERLLIERGVIEVVPEGE